MSLIWLRPGVLILLGLTACLPTATPEASARDPRPVDRPNVLIFVTDDQPIGTLRVMPKTRRHFVEHGTKFNNAFATNPMCCPARATLMTGRYSHNNGVKSNEDVQDLDMQSTLQRYLQHAGYQTGMYGKFLNRWHADPPHFDRWGVITGPYRHYDTVWNVDGQHELVAGYWTDALARRSVAFLESLESSRDEEPWLLYVSTPAPHSPYRVAPEYQVTRVPEWKMDPAVRERDKTDKPRYVRDARASTTVAARVARRQMRMLKSVDDLVDDIMRTLEALGEENTIAFFVSDNGYLWGQHGLLGSGISKGNPYVRSVKVPMMLRWPQRVPAGRVDNRLVGLVDVAPTILDAVGLDAADDYPLDGRSLLDDWERPVILNEFWPTSDGSPSQPPQWAALRAEHYNYVEYRLDGRVIFREYYDLRSDPHELRNLFADRDPSNDPRIEPLQSVLAGFRRCGGESCP
ncbi:MAG TPA: sulfatase [Actinomycetota bacterium]|nr:sulfatase [Actinomycetota bacterium]